METSLEKAMKDRVLTGFKNWNSGYESWLEWCNTLYEPDSYYNVAGQRLTLQEYKDLMGKLFQVFDIELGKFHNMIAKDDWISIRYDVTIINKHTGERTEQQTMEFVNFKDNPEPIGARVIEGWALSDKPVSAPH
ncbi:MAG: nuclear transport factor 2 family protein [Bacteroidales bacterium]|nr:nuclear transport factor 2 family protein [Bacteroidales bacterium]